MADQPRTRKEVFDALRRVTKTQFIYEEMVRLGFWHGPHPRHASAGPEQRRLAELQGRLSALRSEQARLGNREALLKEARKRRIAESRKRQQENKARRERERLGRAEAWRHRKAREIVYLGEGVSTGLGRRDLERDRLEVLGLPVLASPEEVATAMGLSVGQLRFMAFHRPVSHVTHYVRFRIPKKTGGERLISAPMPRLKAAQRWVLENILQRVPTHDAAHGFVPGRSIVTNAAPHVGMDVVINMDLKDFFPTLTWRRVRGLFQAIGYSQAAATVFALLCTEPEVETVQLDGETWHVALGDRALPQGAPSSPAITNLICRRLDERLSGLANSMGFAYTRYADDLSFSTQGDGAGLVGILLAKVRDIVADEGFKVHPDKTRVMRKGCRQEVTGIVVNERPNVPRATLRRFRATLFQIEKDGPEGKRWGHPEVDVLASVEGFANFVHMVDPERGAPLKARVRALLEKHGRPAAKTPARARPARSDDAAASEGLVEAPASGGDVVPPGDVDDASASTSPAEASPSAAPSSPTPGSESPDAGSAEQEDGESGDGKWWKMW